MPFYISTMLGFVANKNYRNTHPMEAVKINNANVNDPRYASPFDTFEEADAFAKRMTENEWWPKRFRYFAIFSTQPEETQRMGYVLVAVNEDTWQETYMTEAAWIDHMWKRGAVFSPNPLDAYIANTPEYLEPIITRLNQLPRRVIMGNEVPNIVLVIAFGMITESARGRFEVRPVLIGRPVKKQLITLPVHPVKKEEA